MNTKFIVSTPTIAEVKRILVNRYFLKGGPTLKAIAAVKYYGLEMSQTTVAS